MIDFARLLAFRIETEQFWSVLSVYPSLKVGVLKNRVRPRSQAKERSRRPGGAVDAAAVLAAIRWTWIGRQVGRP